jgi:hypothetical protein
MPKARLAWPAAIALFACSAASSVVTLRPEERASLRIGDVAAVRVDSNRHYSVGSAGTALTLLKRTEARGTTVYLYRAVSAGNQTFVLTPRDPGPDGCISCVTLHYFVEVLK